MVVVLAGVAAGAYALVHRQLHSDPRRAAVEKFTAAWARGDYETMYGLLDARSRAANPKISFLADYRRANKAAGVRRIALGKLGPLGKDGAVRAPVTIQTREF